MKVRDRIFECAAERHGYITSRDAGELGIDPSLLRQMAARGALERVARGAYRLPFLPRSEHDDLAEAVAWTLGRGVISHESAFVLYGFSDVNPTWVHITVPARTSARADGGDLYRVYRRNLPEGDIAVKDGLPVTTIARTVIDCIEAGTSPYQLRLAVDEAQAAGEITGKEAERLRQTINESRPGRRFRRRRRADDATTL